MLQITDGLDECAVMLLGDGAGPAGTGNGEDKRGLPDEAGEASWSQGEGDGDTFTSIGALAGAVVRRLEQDRAARIAPRETARAPAGGNVAPKAGRRPTITRGGQMPTIGETHFFATILAALANERRDRGEALLGYIEAEAGYLRDRMPGTADTMRIACRDARRLRARDHAAAE